MDLAKAISLRRRYVIYTYLSHALFIKRLLPSLLSTFQVFATDVRVVSLPSIAYIGNPSIGIIFKDLKTPQNFLVG